MKKYLSSYWFRSAFFTFLQRFSLTLFGLINFMILIRVLTKPQMGVWALFLIVTTTFELTKAGLLKNAHIKFVSSDVNNFDKTHIASSSLAINVAVSLIFIAFISVFHNSVSNFFSNGSDLSDMLLWFIPGLIFMVFFSHLEAIQQSHFDFKGIFAGHLTRQISFFIMISVQFLLKNPFTMIHLAIFQSFSIFLGTLTLYLYSRKYMLHIFNPSKIWIKKLTGYGGYIFGTGLIANLSTNTDQMMMGAFMTPSSVATYNVSSRISGIVDIPSSAASEILFPKLVQANEMEGSSRVKYFFEKMTSVLLSIVIPSAIFVILFPKFVIGIVAGKDYYEAAFILQLYVFTSIFGVFQNQAANTLNSIGKPYLCFKLNLASFIAKLIITYSCLVAFGFYGAAVGTLITYVLTSFLWYYNMKKIIGVKLIEILKMLIKVYQDIFSKALKVLKKSPTAG